MLQYFFSLVIFILVAFNFHQTYSATKQPKVSQTSALVRKPVPKPADGSAQEFNFPFTLPQLGPITFGGWLHMESKTYDFDAKFPPGTTFDLELIKISSPSGSFSSDLGLQFFADFKLFGFIDGKMSIDNITKTDDGDLVVVIGLNLFKDFVIPIAPGKTIPLTKFNLALSKKEKKIFRQFSLNSTSETPDATLTFGTDNGELFAQIEIDDLKIEELIPETKGSSAGKVSLKKGFLKIINPFNKKPKLAATKEAVPSAVQPDTGRRVIYSAEINLESLASTLPKGSKLDNLKCEGTYSEAVGFSIKTTLESNLELLPGCFVKNPSITIAKLKPEHLPNKTAQEKEALAKQPAAKTLVSMTALEGTLQFNMPKGMGNFVTTVRSTLENNEFRSFEGVLDNDLKITDDVNFKGAKLQVSKADPKAPALSGVKEVGRVTFSSNFTILNYEVDGFLTVAQIEKNNKKEWDVTFRGALPKMPNLQPFKALKIPGLEDFTLSNLGIGFDMQTKSFFIEGDAKILKIPFRASITSGKDFTAVKGNILPGWKISDTIPDLAGSPLEKIDFSKAKVIIASNKYTDPVTKTDIPKGISLAVSMSKEDGMLKQIKNLVPGIPDEIHTLVSLGGSIKDIKLQANIPSQMKLGSKATIDNLVFEFDGSGPKLSLIGKASVKPSPADEPLNLYTRVKVEPDSASVSGTMEGEWKNPFGIKGFRVADVALEVGVDYPVFMATGLPTRFGLTGAMQIGDVRARVATLVTANMADIILYGSLTQLYLSDIAKMAVDAGAKIPLNQVPKFGMKDIEIKVAPTGGSIGEIEFDPGLTFKGKIEVLDEWALVNINVSTGGIIAEGSCSQLDLGPVTISGKGLDQKYGTPDDGPTISFALTPQKQHFMVSGLMKIFGSSAQAEVYFGSKGFEFLSSLKIDRIALSDVIKGGISSGLKLPTDALPELALTDAEITVGMKGEKFKSFSLDPGVTVKGKVNIFGAEGDMNVALRNNGIKARGKLKKLECGPVIISGMGEDGKYDTPDDGAIIDLVLTTTEQSLLLSGLMQIFGSSSQTDIKLNKEGFLLYTSTKIEKLTLLDILNIGNKSGKPQPELKLPNMGLKYAEYTLGLAGESLLKPRLAPGLKMKCVVGLPFLGDGSAQVSMLESGFSMAGTLPNVDLGPLKITGAGLDGKYGTEDDGVTFEMTLTKDRQAIVYSGMGSFLGTGGQTELIYDGTSFRFTMGLTFFGRFKGILKGAVLNLPTEIDSISDVKKIKDIDFSASGEVSSGIDAAFIDRTKESAKKDIEAAREKLRGAIKKVEDAQQEVRKIDTRIDELKRKLGAVEHNRFDITQDYLPQQQQPLYAWSKFTGAVKSIGSGASNLGSSALNKAKEVGSDIKDGASKVADKAGDALGDAGKKIGNAAQSVMDKTTLDEHAELRSLQGAKPIALGALEAAELALRGLEKAAGVSSKIVDLGLKILDTFSINKIKIEIDSMKKIATGKSPITIIEGILNGKDFSLRIEADITKADDLALKLARALVSKLKDAIM